jgi:predicted lipid-binding transport protein (Tim44 family)
MVVLALALLILVLVFSVAIVLSNPDVYQLSLFRVLVPVTSAGVFFTGFGAALVTITALLLLRTGIRRARENRRRLRTADRAAVTSAGATEGRSRRDRDVDPNRNAPAARERRRVGARVVPGRPTSRSRQAPPVAATPSRSPASTWSPVRI